MLSALRQPRAFYRRLLYLALPVIAQNLITTSLGFMDTFMVGLLGSEEMSAVTVANVPIFIIQLVVFGLQSGSSVLISQFWGKGDRESINRVMGLGAYIAGGVSLTFALVMFFLPRQVLLLVTDNLRLIALAEPYLQIVGFSYVFNSLASVYIGMQRSIENPKFGMIVFALSTLCNTVGNYILIFGKFGAPALGITGAAIATLASRVLELVLSLGYALRCRRMPLLPRALLCPGTGILRRFLRYSTPVLLNETLWGLGTSLFTVVMGHMAISTDILAAYTVAGNIDKLVTVAMFGVAAAAAVIVGTEIGAGSRESVLQIGKCLSAVAFLVGIGICALELGLYFGLLREHLLPLFSLNAAAASLCTVMVVCNAVRCPFDSFVTTMIVGVLRGGGDVHAALLIDILPLWLFALPLTALAAAIPGLSPVWVCVAMVTQSVPKVPAGLARLRSGTWVRDVTKRA